MEDYYAIIDVDSIVYLSGNVIQGDYHFQRSMNGEGVRGDNFTWRNFDFAIVDVDLKFCKVS